MCAASTAEVFQAEERLQPITADDAAIAEALKDAHIPSLMLALVHLTGDLSLLRGEIRPKSEFLGTDDGLNEAQRQQVRDHALAVLRRHRDQPRPFYQPTEAELREMLSFLAGSPIPDDYAAFMRAELALDGQDPYAQPAIFEVPEAKRRQLRVLVIGAGMSGLLAGVRLKEAGIPFRIVEKNADVGGTWYENTYPGCRVDSANHVYSYSFRPQDWPQHFSNQSVLRQYFSDTAKEFGLRGHIAFNTEVTEARFDEDAGLWRVTVRNHDGESETLEANAVISAVGQLNRPKMPEIPGIDRFAGPSFHSARWDHGVDLAGKRVGVIGTGASAFQFVPIVAGEAQAVTIFQRTAPWVVPNPNYFRHVPEGMHWLLSHVPFYARWYRFATFWNAAEGLLHAVTAEPGWDHPEESVGAANAMLREALLANLRRELEGRDDLLEMCTPDYPPGAKRALIDDGTWLRSLRRENVRLTTDPIAEITERGVRCESGEQHEFDVLIYATGFKASDFLFPMRIYGRGGQELHEMWNGDPRAYKGISVPGFPNLFLCYGPNTNIVVNGSIIFFSECEVRYILGCLAMLLDSGAKAIDVRREVHDAYNEKIDAGNRRMAWGQSSVNTWYKNAAGRITQNWPGTLLEFWQQTRAPDPQDYRLI